ALTVECTFQFPLALAAGALATALLVAFALAVADESEPASAPARPRRLRPAVGWALAASAATTALLRIGGADYVLARHPRRRAAAGAGTAPSPSPSARFDEAGHVGWNGRGDHLQPALAARVSGDARRRRGLASGAAGRAGLGAAVFRLAGGGERSPDRDGHAP